MDIYLNQCTSDTTTRYNYGNLLRNINRYEEAEKQYQLVQNEICPRQ